MCEMSYEEAAFELAGTHHSLHLLAQSAHRRMCIAVLAAERGTGDVSLLKYSCTRVATLVADEAVQIFGGRGAGSFLYLD